MCPLDISDLRSLDFVISRFFVKLFNTNVIDTVKLARITLNSIYPEKRRENFFQPFEIFEKTFTIAYM